MLCSPDPNAMRYVGYETLDAYNRKSTRIRYGDIIIYKLRVIAKKIIFKW